MNPKNEEETKQVRWRERLVKLEEELDQLMQLEERRRKGQLSIPVFNDNERACTQKTKCLLPSCSCYNCPKSQPQPRCDDIFRFLKNINFNLAKGTEAINKIGNFATLSFATQAAICAPHLTGDQKNDLQFKSNVVSNEDVIAFKSWKKSVGNSNNIDDLFKELRSEKDKRQRAENQLKMLKEDLKTCRSSVEQEWEEKIQQINQELKKTKDVLEKNEKNYLQINHDLETKILALNVKHEILLRDLEEERGKRKDIESEKKELEMAIEQKVVKYKESLLIRNQLEEQTGRLENLSGKLSAEKEKSLYMELKIEEVQKQLLAKQKVVDQCTYKIKQLLTICEKFKDQLMSYKQKHEVGQKEVEKKRSQIQKLTIRSEELQSTIERLKKQLNKTVTMQNSDREKYKTEIVSLESDIENLRNRLYKLIEINKKQESLISSQNETIERKQNQLWEAFSEVSRLQQHIQNAPPIEVKDTCRDFDKTVAQLRKQIENEKETMLIKEKIIEDQSETIEELKRSLNSSRQEVFHLQKVQSENQRELAIQRTVNEELSSKVKKLQSKKEEMRQQLQELENELEEFQWQSQSSTKDEQLLEKLEQQVMERQKEWETQVEKLQRERDDAIRESRCAKQMLQQKCDDFEQKLTSQYQMQSILEEKEAKLRQCEKEKAYLNAELQRRTIHFKESTVNLIKASEVWRDAVTQIKSQTTQV